MANKGVYKCGICGAEHDCVADRMMCEMQCFEKQKEEARIAAENKKRAEKNIRQAEVDKAVESADKLIGQFVKDYGSYRYNGELEHYFEQLHTPFWFY